MPSHALETMFFRQDRTITALSELASAKQLVIYCGAGVSIDRTGVGWRGLIQRVFNLGRNTGRAQPGEVRGIDALMESDIPAEHLASLVVGGLSGDESENDFLGSKLKEILYVDNGWNPGQLLRNVIQAALIAGTAGHAVSIVTTNYDEYLEVAFRSRRKRAIDGGADPAVLPGMTRWTFDSRGAKSNVVVESPAGATTIKLTYLHGRVSRKAKVDGRLVLSELSYARSRARSWKVLQKEFAGDDTAVLVVGASLTDQPLIYALAKTRKSRGPRYALISAPSPTPPVSPTDVKRALMVRGRHLGIQLLFPIAHFQIAQFMEELRVSIATKDRDSQVSAGYPDRLNQWSRSWLKSKAATDPRWVHDQLFEGLGTLVTDFFEHRADPSEIFRLEAWVRHQPSGKHRMLTLWGSSSGPILDTSARREEQIDATVPNASVKAFLAGRPLLTTLESLGQIDMSTRWKTFLSVPITVQLPVVPVEDRITAVVPVGVVTLASTKRLSGSVESERSIFAEEIDNPTLARMKKRIIEIGQLLLAPEQPNLPSQQGLSYSGPAEADLPL